MSSFGWALAAAFCWGLTPMLEKFGLEGVVDPVPAVFVRSIGVLLGALCFIPFWHPVSGRFSGLPARTWILLGAGGITASVIGQLCFYRALKFGEVSRVVPIAASYPALSFFLGLLIWKEPLTLGKACGVLLIITGAFLLR